MVKDTQSFLVLLRQGMAKFRTQREFVKAIGITESRASRVKKGDAGVFRVDNCLRLAKILKRSPGEVLRACGPRNAQTADLLDELYGPDRMAALRIDDEEMAALWRDLDVADREMLRSHARRLTETQADEAPAPKPSPKAARQKHPPKPGPKGSAEDRPAYRRRHG